MIWPMLLTLLALGLGGGFLSGLLGLGGAIFMIPLLLYVPPLLGVGLLTMKEVAAVSMVQVLSASLTGVLVHNKNKFVSKQLLIVMGVMNAVGNLKPKVLAQMCEAVFKGDHVTGRRLHEQLLEINKAVFFDTNPIPMKYMMKKLGLLADNEHRLPMVSATPELAAKLDGVLERAGL